MKNIRKLIFFLILVLTLTACGNSTDISKKQRKKELARMTAYLQHKYPGKSFSVDIRSGYKTIVDESGKSKQQSVLLRTATDKNGITFSIKEIRSKKTINYEDDYCDLYNQQFYQSAIQEYINECYEKYGNFSYFTDRIISEDPIILENTVKLFESKEEAIKWYCSNQPLEFVFTRRTFRNVSEDVAKITLSELQEVKENTFFRKVWIKYDNLRQRKSIITIISNDLSIEEIQEELLNILTNE